MKRYVIDTNLILRFLTGEPASHAKLAAEFLKKGEDGKYEVHISPLVVAEVVFVLTGKIYQCERVDVAGQVSRFLSNPAFEVHERDELLHALDLFKTHKIDFADAYLASIASSSKSSIVTFDKDFKQIKGLQTMLLTDK